MNNITEHIRNRRSVRTYDGRELDKNDIEKLTAFTQTIENPYKIPVDFKFMNAKDTVLTVLLRWVRIYLSAVKSNAQKMRVWRLDIPLKCSYYMLSLWESVLSGLAEL